MSSARPWAVAMRWHDLLFAHWRVDARRLRPLVPASLDLDVHDGSAWIGVVPFRMTGVRPRGVPALPWLSAFPELNVRTYVTARGGDAKPGVWFFSLDAARLLAVRHARAKFHLPYFHARMRCRARADGIDYASVRIVAHHPGAPAAAFAARYRPTGPPCLAKQGTLDQFLTARLCLYAVDGGDRLFRGDIDHPPWPLQPAEATIERNTMVTALGLPPTEGAPLLHFARRLDVIAWPLESVRSMSTGGAGGTGGADDAAGPAAAATLIIP